MPSTTLRQFEVVVRRFDSEIGPDDPDAVAFVLPVDSPDAEHAVSAAMANAVAFTTKVAEAGGTIPVAFWATDVRERA